MMALYEYVCDEKHTLEISHPMAESPRVICAECYKEMRKGMTAPKVWFKGGGFYSTDKND